MKRTLLAALIISASFSSSFALANPVMPTPPAKFDCGALNASQAEKIEKETTGAGLKDLAKTCEDQAMTFQKIAVQAQDSLTKQDVTELYEKAANAQLYVANFTNSALFKNN